MVSFFGGLLICCSTIIVLFWVILKSKRKFKDNDLEIEIEKLKKEDMNLLNEEIESFLNEKEKNYEMTQYEKEEIL